MAPRGRAHEEVIQKPTLRRALLVHTYAAASKARLAHA